MTHETDGVFSLAAVLGQPDGKIPHEWCQNMDPHMEHVHWTTGTDGMLMLRRCPGKLDLSREYA